MPAPSVDIGFVKSQENVNFENVAAYYKIELKGAGDQKTALCPFHEDTRASFGCSQSKKIFQCFGCKKKGNILDFVMFMEELDARKAAMKLAEICGVDTSPSRNTRKITSEKITPAERLKRRSEGIETDPIKKTVEPEAEVDEAKPEEVKPEPHVFEPYIRALQLNPDNDFLHERVSKEMIEAFELGYCKAGYQRQRIAIRIHDADGNPLGYAGRWADGELPEDAEKYLLPKYFPKSSLLFNLHRLPPETDEVVLVESFFSVFKLHGLDYSVVSPMGSSISDQQIELLRKRGITKARVLFDGDEAGNTGRKSAVAALSEHMFVYAPEVPDGFKPHKAEENLLHTLLH